MTERLEQFKETLSHLHVERTPDQLNALLAGMRQRQQHQRTTRRAALAAAAALVLTTVSVLFLWPDRSATHRPIDAPTQLADGTRLEPLTPTTQLWLEPPQAELEPKSQEGSPKRARVRVRLERGEARFEVTPNPSRTFEVDAGHVRVKVLGTRFQVDRSSKRVVVTVQEGRVAVMAEGRSWELGTGAQGAFPLDAEPVVAPEAAKRANPQPDDHPLSPQRGIAPKRTASAEHPSSGRARAGRDGISGRPQSNPAGHSGDTVEDPAPPHPKAPAAPEGDWRALATARAYAEAAALIEAKPSRVSHRLGDLLLAADAMRRSGKPAQALTYLEQVQRRHGGNPRAAAANFTRGRILLYQMGQPHRAAQLFAQISRSGGALAQDALAREVEAWAKAGQVAKARSRAQLYLKRYPHGPRATIVRHHGGLE